MSDYTPSPAFAADRYASGRRVQDARDASLTPVGELEAEFNRMIEAVRAEERERYDPAKDERLARYMALVTPLGYAAAFDVVNAMTALMNVEARANEIAEQARREEREKAAQIAEELEGLADSLDEHVSRDEVYGALMALSAQIREQGKEQGS